MIKNVSFSLRVHLCDQKTSLKKKLFLICCFAIFFSVVDGTLNAIHRALPAGQVKYKILCFI